jgi:hypothetical protein
MAYRAAAVSALAGFITWGAIREAAETLTSVEAVVTAATLAGATGAVVALTAVVVVVASVVVASAVASVVVVVVVVVVGCAMGLTGPLALTGATGAATLAATVVAGAAVVVASVVAVAVVAVTVVVVAVAVAGVTTRTGAEPVSAATGPLMAVAAERAPPKLPISGAFAGFSGALGKLSGWGAEL